MEGVVRSGSKALLLKFVRSLTHSRNKTTTYRMRDLPRDSGEDLSALPNIHTLKLYHIRVEHIGGEGFCTCFSAFGETLSTLSLGPFATSFSTFVTLVDCFPNITSLELGKVILKPDEGPVPVLSRSLRGKVHIWGAQVGRSEFVDRFAKLCLEYEELVLDSFYYSMGSTFLEDALQISTNTVKYLMLAVERE